MFNSCRRLCQRQFGELRRRSVRTQAETFPISLGLDHFKGHHATRVQKPMCMVEPFATPVSLDFLCHITKTVFKHEDLAFPEVLQRASPWAPSAELQETIGSASCTIPVSKELRGQVVAETLYRLSTELDTAHVPSEIFTSGQLTVKSAWPVNGTWYQLHHYAELGIKTQSPVPPHQFYAFHTDPVPSLPKIEADGMKQENTCIDFMSGFRNTEVALPMAFPVFVVPEINDAASALGLSYLATGLVAQAFLLDHDKPAAGYCIITDGNNWRMLCFQLNTLDFNSTLSGPKNGCWSCDFNICRGSSEVNANFLRFLYGILCIARGT